MKKRTVTTGPEAAPMEYWKRAKEKMDKDGKRRLTVVLSPEAQEALKAIMEREEYFSMNEAINQTLLRAKNA